jgi:Contact-dependent growth inhibition CdiA C-terminal domain
MSVKINPILPKHQPSTNYKPTIKPKVADKTKQTNQAIKNLAVRFGGEDEVKPPKKTVDDFYRDLSKNSTLKPKDGNKMFEVEFSVGKSPQKASIEDYRKAFDTKLLTIAGYKMFDEREIGLARSLMNTEDNWTLKNIGLRDAKDGRQDGNLKVGVSKFSLENTKLAGQAVLQFRDYESKLKDSNNAKAENETNQKFVDQGRVIYNSIVNNVEGAINLGIDGILSNGGQKPLVLINPNRPQVNLSGIKADYQSEMMRTDVNGKLDGNGLKRGDFTEGAVTILAPLVVGKVTTPTTPFTNVVPKGKLIIEGGRTLTFEESIIANKLTREGKIVEAPIEASNKGIKNVRTPDFIVDGVKTELKTISNLKGKDMSASLSRRILDGAGQGSNIIIDARNQIGMTEEIAKSGIKRAYGRLDQLGSKRLSEVRVIGNGFDITIKFNK